MYQNYYFDVSLVIRSKKPLSSCVYEINLGFLEDEFKEKNYFYVSLNTNEIKNYIKREVEKLPITYMFNTKPISFYVYVSIHRSIEYMRALHDERVARINTFVLGTQAHNSGSESEQTFKEDECVICLSEPPNVLFCNCGHIATCVECSKIESLEKCPICKNENIILRIIE